jgi:hypothetical protein
MAQPADKDKIEFLVRRRFGRISSAPPPFARGVSVHLSNERIAGKHASVREAMDAYRAKLQAMTSEEIAGLYEAERSRREQERHKEQEELRAEAEKRERERFFNQPTAMADVNHWSKAAYWSLDEATALSLSRAPEVVKWDNVKGYVQTSPFAHKYERVRDLVLRAQGAKQLFDPALPGFFIAWAKRTEIEFFPELERAVVARGVVVGDWKSSYDELKKKYDEAAEFLNGLSQRVRADQDVQEALRARVGELEAKLNATPPLERGVLGKERESVLKLIIGMAIKGYRYDPTSSRSATVSEITSDLEQLGLSLSDDTVRKWLKEAAELLPRGEQK